MTAWGRGWLPWVMLLAALCAGVPLSAQERQGLAPCPSADDITPQHLYGLWQLRLWPEGGSEERPVSSGALLFNPHPEYPGSVRGELRRSATGHDLSAQVSGDVTDGEFNLDESDDGVNMSAVWTGEPQDCARSIRGTRRPADGRPAGEPVMRFSLTRPPVGR